MSLKRPRSPSPKSTTSDTDHEVWTSSKIEDRSSIFQGYFSPTMPAKELQNQDETESASHRMLAWRLPSSQRTVIGNKRTLESGTDDDGERYGGRHILKVLEDMRVEGVCMVARWYGGVMLGPVRFAHIEECAGEAIRACRQGADSEGMKRRRVEDEEMEVASLAVELEGRDESIRVLRGLLEEKMGRKAEVKGTGAGAGVVKVEYGGMTLERLRLLDKARDNTVAFLLKRIDEAEKKKAAETEKEAYVQAKEPVETETNGSAGTATGETTTEERTKGVINDSEPIPGDLEQQPKDQAMVKDNTATVEKASPSEHSDVGRLETNISGVVEGNDTENKHGDTTIEATELKKDAETVTG